MSNLDPDAFMEEYDRIAFFVGEGNATAAEESEFERMRTTLIAALSAAAESEAGE